MVKYCLTRFNVPHYWRVCAPKHKSYIFFLVMICLSWAGCSLMGEKVHITEIKMATSIDVNLAPVQVMDTFPEGTTKVFCWFKWQDSPVGTQLVAKWNYLTEKIHILDYSISLPRRNGMGGISVAMPEGKTLPSGSYQITLQHEKRIIKSIRFQVK
jgi:hypothetical protein